MYNGTRAYKNGTYPHRHSDENHSTGGNWGKCRVGFEFAKLEPFGVRIPEEAVPPTEAEEPHGGPQKWEVLQNWDEHGGLIRFKNSDVFRNKGSFICFSYYHVHLLIIGLS